MNFIKNSIRTKFIVLLSVLMAVILAIQFYFMNQTHQDMLEELTHLSESINLTTNRIIVNEFDKANLDSTTFFIEKTKMRELEEVQNELAVKVSELKWQQLDSIKNTGNIIMKKRMPGIKRLIEEIDIHIPLVTGERDSFLIRADIETKGEFRDQILSINVPDFSVPHEPRLLKYKYNTSSVELALQDIYRRNLLITLLIFGLSLIVIIYITRRFLQPIEQLKNSFENVVNGDLNVQVQTGGADEIGSLTRSFNAMVGELLKNRQKEKLMQRKERLASLGQLAAGVAHEIKNPLNAINLTISHLNDKYIPKDSAAALKYSQTMQAEIQRLDKIVNNFLNYLRSEDLKKEKVDVNRLLEQALQLYEREIKANAIQLKKNLAKQFILKADEERLKTALVNILVNAIQAMPDGGSLTIITDNKLKEIRIADSGKGISQKDQEHVFDLFYTTKQNGSGLGLPTAYKIIREHGADIQISSEQGKGTTIIIQWAD